jgi:hypoxanthine phosphoribosyltransferase
MTEYDAVLAKADLLYNMEEIDAALAQLAEKLTADYADKNPLMLTVMNGAVMTAGYLLPKLKFKLEIDYIHASRYGDKIIGGDLNWHSQPTIALKNRHIVLIEDIYDEGITLNALRQFCIEAGAASVRCVALVDKLHNNKTGTVPEYIGLTVADRYVFGFGMDVEGYWRNLPAIYAMKES